MRFQNGRQEAVEALVALGYSSADALRAVRKVTDVPPDDVEGRFEGCTEEFLTEAGLYALVDWIACIVIELL